MFKPYCVLAVSLYGEDYDGFSPLVYGGTPIWMSRWHVRLMTLDYMPKMDPTKNYTNCWFRCPSLKSPYADGDAINWNVAYGMLTTLEISAPTYVRRCVKLFNLPGPSRQLWLADSYYVNITAQYEEFDGGFYLPTFNVNADNYMCVQTRHLNTANFWCVDGHVASADGKGLKEYAPRLWYYVFMENGMRIRYF